MRLDDLPVTFPDFDGFPGGHAQVDIGNAFDVGEAYRCSVLVAFAPRYGLHEGYGLALGLTVQRALLPVVEERLEVITRRT